MPISRRPLLPRWRIGLLVVGTAIALTGCSTGNGITALLKQQATESQLLTKEAHLFTKGSSGTCNTGFGPGAVKETVVRRSPDGYIHVQLTYVAPLQITTVHIHDKLAAIAPQAAGGTEPVYVCPGGPLTETGISLDRNSGLVTSYFRATSLGDVLLHATVPPAGPIETPVLEFGIRVER